MELEEALGDRLSFKHFTGLALQEVVPEHSRPYRFRSLPIVEGLLEKLFGELDRQLEAAGPILRRGAVLDATTIETTAAQPPRGRNGDLDAAAGYCNAPRRGRGNAPYRLTARSLPHLTFDSRCKKMPANAQE